MQALSETAQTQVRLMLHQASLAQTKRTKIPQDKDKDRKARKDQMVKEQMRGPDTRYIAKQYGLSKDAIANGLPLIDTTKTLIEGYCPAFLMTPKCEVERYRSITGVCNNIEHPHWGAAMNAHHRLLAPDYADGISAPRFVPPP